VRGARLARLVWKDEELAQRLAKEAADLKRRFNRDFWVEEDEYFALALDENGEQVDSLTSNNGHLLWSGIVDKSKANGSRTPPDGAPLFSGWGVRTLAEGEARYNPIGYHVGTVWPFDCSFIAWGLRRYGFKERGRAHRGGDSSTREFFGGRLPEAFGGYARSVTRIPVQYPTACSPQAWSTGAPLLLLRTMLGLEPIGEPPGGRPGAPTRDRSSRTARHSGRWGWDRRVRARARRRRLTERSASVSS
jgi:glycogen debranching enzyme